MGIWLILSADKIQSVFYRRSRKEGRTILKRVVQIMLNILDVEQIYIKVTIAVRNGKKQQYLF